MYGMVVLVVGVPGVWGMAGLVEYWVVTVVWVRGPSPPLRPPL